MSDISPKGFEKIPHTVLPSLKTLKETDIADRNGMDKSCQPSRKARKHYWMMELRIMYPYGNNDRYGDEYKTENMRFKKRFLIT